GVVEARLEKEGGDTWIAQMPLPAPAPPAPPPAPGAPALPPAPPKTADVTALAMNNVGLISEPVSLRIQLIDPPLGGTIRVTVAMSKYGKPLPGVKVIMMDTVDGKEKGAGQTDEKTGELIFKDVPPGNYRLISARPDSGVGTKGFEDVRVRAGEETPARIV